MPTTWLLRAGIGAGVLVPLVIWADGATRPGYSLWHHGASQLGTGDRAWLQAINFVLGGLLMGLFAVGARRALRGGRGATWGPALLGTAAAGLVVAGLVPTDPALGYPPGVPSAAGPSAAGLIHQVAGLALFAGLGGAAFVLARRFRESPGWARYSRLTGAAVIAFAFAAGIAYRLDVLGVWRPAPAGLLENLSLLAGFCWTIAIAARLDRSDAPALESPAKS